MELGELISVIVPVYGVEEYIARTIESILNQTYSNLEIILVDDGTQDKSGEICDKYAAEDKRIRVIHQNNRGLSAARNVGIKEASGKYLGFVDGDDYIDKDMYMAMHSEMIKNNADIVVCDFTRVRDGKEESVEREEIRESVEVYKGIEGLINICSGKRNEGARTIVAWNKLYKKKIYRNISYPEGKIHEDNWVIHYSYSNANNIVYLNKVLYYYTIRMTSISKEKYSEKNLEDLWAHRDRVYFLIDQVDQEFLGKMYLMYIKAAQYALNQMENDASLFEKMRKNVLRELKQDYKALRNKIQIDRKNKVKLYLFIKCEKMFRLLCLILKKNPYIT